MYRLIAIECYDVCCGAIKYSQVTDKDEKHAAYLQIYCCLADNNAEIITDT
jgi:hypothetical protein